MEPHPELVGPLAADAGQHPDQAFEGQFIARIGDELQVGRDVLDVRLFEEADAAGDEERMLRRVSSIWSSIAWKCERYSTRRSGRGGVPVAQFEHPLGDEGGLFPGVVADHEGGVGCAGSRRPGGAWELARIGGEGGVGERENFRGAAVVGLDAEHLVLARRSGKPRMLAKIGARQE